MYISGFLEEPSKPPEVLYNSGGFVQQRRFCTTAVVLYNSGSLVQQRRSCTTAVVLYNSARSRKLQNR
jgi:hypothetical protein